MTQQRCHLTDLPLASCGCPDHHHDETTVVSIAALEKLAGRPLPDYRFRVRRPRWRVPDPEQVACTHQRHGLCKPCDDYLDGLLADLPHLVEELGYAMRRDVAFTPHGFRPGDEETPDEAPLSWNVAAADMLRELARITGGRPRRPQLLAGLSKAVKDAHRIIDRPKDRVYCGPCPSCGQSLEGVRGQPVTCAAENCQYAATWDQHNATALEARQDQLLPMHDLLKVLQAGGRPLARKQVEWLQKRYGLPREQRSVPYWAGHELRVAEVWCYRVRDVLELQDRLDSSRRPVE